MQNEVGTWHHWRANLDRMGLRSFCAWMLEAAGPVTFLGAQALYVGQPLLSVLFPRTPEKNLLELTGLLENPGQTRAFIQFLREESPVGS